MIGGRGETNHLTATRHGRFFTPRSEDFSASGDSQLVCNMILCVAGHCGGSDERQGVVGLPTRSAPQVVNWLFPLATTPRLLLTERPTFQNCLNKTLQLWCNIDGNLVDP